MINKKVAWTIVLSLITAWLANQSFAFYQQKFPNRVHTMNIYTSDVKPICFGRYMLNVPKASKSLVDSFSINGHAAAISQNVSESAFKRIVEKRWLELKGKVKDTSGSPYIEEPKRFDIFEHAIIFNYDYEDLDVSMTAEPKIKRTYTSEAYYWKFGQLIKFNPDMNADSDFRNIITNFSPLSPEVAPVKSGLCLGNVFYSAPTQHEGVTISIRLDNSPIKLSVSHGYIDDAFDSTQGLLEQRSETRILYKDVFEGSSSHIYRQAKRTVGRLAGEEYIEGQSEKTDEGAVQTKTKVKAEWRSLGNHTQSSQTVNAIQILTLTHELPGTGKLPDVKMPSGLVAEEEFLSVWDSVVESIRPRADAF